MHVGRSINARLNRAALRLIAGLVLALAGLAGPALAKGTEDGLGPACHAAANTSAQADALRSSARGWTCEDRDWSAAQRHVLLRFDLGIGGQVPAELTTRLARFEAMQIEIERPDGSLGRYQRSMHDFEPKGHMGQAMALPEGGEQARRLTIEYVGPTVTSLVSETRLHAEPEPLLRGDQIWIAVLCGVLLVPLFFNLALFRALRDRFLLWHVGVVAFMLLHATITSGLTPLFVSLPVGSIALMIALTFCGGAASALMMASEFIEPDKLEDGHRRALRQGALWLVFNGAFFVATIDWLQSKGLAIYFVNWMIVIGIAFWTMGAALKRGSRAVKFLIASWMPLIATGLWQIIGGAIGGPYEPMELFVAQRFAIGLEVLIGSVAIADRFIQLRRDRDTHRLRAGEMARLAERDPLTGLLNRRTIESRFAALRSDGFETLALLDLDHFKSVNDRFGHSIGDQVLKVVAAALPEDDDILPMRMGGEEFMLVLRGTDLVQRAERIRQAIAARVAQEVPGLDRPVTASMGIVEIPAQVIPNVSFASIYARADGLLYQAKRAGRNRMVSERLQVFDKHREPRRPAVA
ncbi:MAG: diguanylate cyclase [Novosphingobium sp.]